MTIRLGLVAAAATILFASGCAANGASDMVSSTEPLSPLSRTAIVEVENHNWSDMVVYALHGNSRIRLGMVTSLTTARFELPSSALYTVTDLRLVAEPLAASEKYVSEPIRVNQGQLVELRLENALAISSWSVW